jgi:hypothetical protein
MKTEESNETREKVRKERNEKEGKGRSQTQ